MAEDVGGAGQFVTVEALIRARLSTALGGWRGSVESALPTVAFVGVDLAEHVNPAALAAVAALVRSPSCACCRGRPRATSSRRSSPWHRGVLRAAHRSGRGRVPAGMIQTAATGRGHHLDRAPLAGRRLRHRGGRPRAWPARRAAPKPSGRAERAALSRSEREALEAPTRPTSPR